MGHNHRGFSLVEILVLAAVIAILVVVMGCTLFAGRTRAKVTQTRAEMRTLSIAIEAYMVGSNNYPAWGIGHPGPGGVRTFNWNMAQRTGNRSGVADLPSFSLCDRSTSGGRFNTLTTAVAFIGLGGSLIGPTGGKPGDHFAYVDSYPTDPFCADHGATFVYWNVFPGARGPDRNTAGEVSEVRGLGWICISPGPDGRYDLPGSYSVYNPAVPLPSPLLLSGTNPKGAAFTYDPTNGLVSSGDIWRFKQ